MNKSTTVNRLALRLSIAMAAILVLLPFHALFTTWLGSNFGHLDVWRIWKEIILIIMTPFLIYYVWLSKPVRNWLLGSWISRLFAVYALLYLVTGARALVNHNTNFEAFVYSLIINLRFIDVLILCVILSMHSNFLRDNWHKILLIPAGITVAFGLMQRWLLPVDFLRHFGYGDKTIPAYQAVDLSLDYQRVQSTLRGANPFGAYLLIVIPAALTQIINNWQKWGLAIGGLIAMFYSYSRSAWLGLIVTGAILSWLLVGARYKKWLAAGFGLLFVLLVSLFVMRNTDFVQTTFYHDVKNGGSVRDSNDERLNALKSGFKDVVHEPLGRGPGTAGPASFRNDKPPRIAENYFLQVGQEVGVIGVAIFAAINILVGRQLWLRRRQPFAALLFASLIGLTVVNMLSHAWADDTLAYIFWGLTGVALGSRKK